MTHSNLTRALLMAMALVSTGTLQSVHAEEVEPITPPPLPGICGQVYGLDGRAVIIDGQLVRLVDYCAQRQVILETTDTPDTPDPVGPETVLSEDDRFWQSFLAIANGPAERFAAEAGQEDVINYGKTVCSILQGGTNLEDLQQMQLEGGLPENFDTAVNSAAINIYCPQYRTGAETED